MKMETKHTPGPWKVGRHDGNSGQLAGWQVLSDNPDDRIQGLVCQNAGPDNARLIAAAPDMLAALERYKNEDEEDGVDKQNDTTYLLACAAIAKATGKEE